MWKRSGKKIIEKGIESSEIVGSFSDKEVIEYLLNPASAPLIR